MKEHQLHSLTPTDLIFLIKHVKLGNHHLKAHLTQDEFEQVLKLGHVDEHTEYKMTPGKAETAGTALGSINTVLTTVVGGWMGISTFIGLKLDSISQFRLVLLFSLTLGALIGYQNYRSIKKNTQNAFEKRELLNIEQEVLKKTKAKREKEIEEKRKELNEILKEFKIKTLEKDFPSDLDVKKIASNWIDQIEAKFKELNSPLYQEAKAEIQKVKESLFTKEPVQKEKPKILTLLEKLKGTDLPLPKLSLKAWIKTNYRMLSLNLIPTALGSFSSLLVYFSGLPNLANQMGKVEMFAFFTRPEVKTAELIFDLLVTLYFTYSFLHTNRKQFNKDQELNRANLQVAKEESRMNDLDDRLLKIKELHQIVSRIGPIFRLLNLH